MIDYALAILILGAAASYFLKCMLLEEKTNHEGPFPSKHQIVLFSDPEDGHAQRVALFDRIRRLFGVYRVEGTVWYVIENPGGFTEAFTCFFCLSFWTAIPFTIVLTISVWPMWYMVIVGHFAIATVSALIYQRMWNNADPS